MQYFLEQYIAGGKRKYRAGFIDRGRYGRLKFVSNRGSNLRSFSQKDCLFATQKEATTAINKVIKEQNLVGIARPFKPLYRIDKVVKPRNYHPMINVMFRGKEHYRVYMILYGERETILLSRNYDYLYSPWNNVKRWGFSSEKEARADLLSKIPKARILLPSGKIYNK